MHSVGRFKAGVATPALLESGGKQLKVTVPKEYLRRKLFNRKNDSIVMEKQYLDAGNNEMSTKFNKDLLN